MVENEFCGGFDGASMRAKAKLHSVASWLMNTTRKLSLVSSRMQKPTRQYYGIKSYTVPPVIEKYKPHNNNNSKSICSIVVQH